MSNIVLKCIISITSFSLNGVLFVKNIECCNSFSFSISLRNVLKELFEDLNVDCKVFLPFTKGKNNPPSVKQPEGLGLRLLSSLGEVKQRISDC